MVARAYQPEHQPESDPVVASETLTPQEYLRRERAAETRSEFLGGQLYAMSGASFPHTQITASVSRHLNNQLDGKNGQAVTNDLRVKINDAGDYVYPDVVVVCGGGEWEDSSFDTLLNPTVIIEVLSSSTAQRDRSDKWLRYQQLPSLTDYLMISQHEMRVEHFLRQNENLWLYSIFQAPDDTIELQSANCRLRLSEIYERVQFDAPDTEVATN